MKIAVAQINTVIGDFSGNREKILDFSRRASDARAELVVFPELCICGYPPMDLLDYRGFTARNLESLEAVIREVPEGIAAVVGYVDDNPGGYGLPLRNVASLITRGKKLHTQVKTLLPTYDVFDEARYFEPAEEWSVFNFHGRSIGIAICEDIWREDETALQGKARVSPIMKLADAGAELLLVPSASPFYSGKTGVRDQIVEGIVSRYGIPGVYVNMVGGNDSILFDGNSFVMNASGIVASGASFQEDLFIADPFSAGSGGRVSPPDRMEELAEALAFGLGEYTGRCGFRRVHLGLSGGIDSAVVACIAADAMGPENVTAIAMPSRYSSNESLEDALALTDSLGMHLEILSIEDIFSASLGTLSPVFTGLLPDVTEENLQARIRGLLLMAFSNKFSSLLLETGNKSELATGYCTLYGDMCGGIAPIGDLFKTEVYELAGFYNRDRRRIPERIITKAPSAELRPDQKDEDSLPPYPVLDAILRRYLMDNRVFQEIVAEGYDRDTVTQVLRLVARAEYKRIQAPPVLKVSPKAFGSGRRMPVARAIYEV